MHTKNNTGRKIKTLIIDNIIYTAAGDSSEPTERVIIMSTYEEL